MVLEVMKMKQSVTLKGTKDGFVLTLDESVAFETVLSDLDQLLEKLHSENKEQKEVQKGISLEVKTGMRLFSEDEKAKREVSSWTLEGDVNTNPWSGYRYTGKLRPHYPLVSNRCHSVLQRCYIL